MEAKTREKAEKRRLIEKEDKRKWLAYLQQLQDKVLVEDTTLLEDTEGFQVVETKHKKITTISSEDKAG